VGARVDQQSARETSVKLSELTNQGSLNRPTLDGVQVRYIAFMNPQAVVKRSKHRNRIADPAWSQPRIQWCVTGAIPGLCVHRDPTSNVQYRNDLHRARSSCRL
jgi:hypothetical protein